MQSYMSFLASHSGTDFVKEPNFCEDTTVWDCIFKGAQHPVCLFGGSGTDCRYQMLENLF